MNPGSPCLRYMRLIAPCLILPARCPRLHLYRRLPRRQTLCSRPLGPGLPFHVLSRERRWLASRLQSGCAALDRSRPGVSQADRRQQAAPRSAHPARPGRRLSHGLDHRMEGHRHRLCHLHRPRELVRAEIPAVDGEISRHADVLARKLSICSGVRKEILARVRFLTFSPSR
jgi:hypothetical protein